MSNRIVINLDQTDTKAYASDNLIQADAQESFDNLIKSFITAIDKDKQSKSESHEECRIDRVHNTILVNGKRGMGKTSFILSIQKNKNILKNIVPLCIIDPTLIETKENVLLNIITLIKEKVEEFIRCEKCDDKGTKYRDWKESLKKLAGGLSMLDGVGSDHLKDGMWDSPELILEKGLSNAKQGVDLEKNFHKFIDESLKILDKNAFFLILDDIDTSLDKGSEILETLRKYLTSKKLIIAMLGDIDLYSTLVRQLQWEKMDPKKTLKDYEGTEKYLGQIEHLEEQYLTKVLKPENRIDLKNLLTLKNTLAINTVENHLEDVMQIMIEKVYFTKDSEYAKDFENTLLTQSTRSVIQVLKAWDPEISLNSDLIDRFQHTFYTTLKKKLEAYSLVELPDKEKFLNLLAVYILSENFSKENHLKLTPNFAKDDDNVTMLYLNMMANHLLEPQDYLSYFIKVGYTYEGYEDVDSDKGKDEFIADIVLENRESLSVFSEKVFSSLKLQAPNTIRTGYRYLGNMFILSDELNKVEEKLQFLSCKSPESKQGLNFFSFFKLLGYIADLQYENNKKEDITEWISKCQKVEKLPIFVLAKIWQRVVNTFLQIDKRPENKEKNYAEMLHLYIAGFLNAVFIEIGIYYNQDGKLDNVSASIKSFTDKIDNYNGFGEDYTLFDYLYECPLLKFDSEYFNTLQGIPLEINKPKSNVSKKEKIHFLQRTPEEQKKIIIELLKSAPTSGTTQDAKDAIINKDSNHEALMTYLVNKIGTASQEAKSSIKKILEEIFNKS